MKKDTSLTYEEYEVNDADFVSACNNAPYWTKRRVLKKMTKTRLPKDVEEAVKRFVWAYRDKLEKA